jgi:hypothetical protein
MVITGFRLVAVQFAQPGLAARLSSVLIAIRLRD